MRQPLLLAMGAFFLVAPTGGPTPVARGGFDAPPVSLGPVVADDAAGGGVLLKVMNYNVKGLPWPVTDGRSAELAAIGDRLRAMRTHGATPDVVVLQEAFSSDARAIAARAGYAYVAYGPGRDDVAPASGGQPMPTRYPWRGEGYGAYLSSGLVLMSDYPILGARRAAFPRTACAGYDCLANKGVLLARIAVPGLPVPVEIMTAHMNSRKPTRTPIAHANEAFVRQMAALDRFVAANSDPRLPMIFGADLNLDSDPQRIAALRQSSARWSGGGAGAAATFAICGKPSTRCRPAIGFGAIAQSKRNNDWQLAFASAHVMVRPVSAAIRFAPDPAGLALSDHQAVLVSYRLSVKGHSSAALAQNAEGIKRARPS
ncbi:MAG TPA: endonuclease/exonuclease/phosphatase family protein [Sphingobium sp.]